MIYRLSDPGLSPPGSRAELFFGCWVVKSWFLDLELFPPRFKDWDFFCQNETNDSIIVFLLTRIKEIRFNGKKLFV